jgi:hypothetical protein
MRSEKQRQRQREQQRRKRERRREHARQTLALLAGELDRPSLSGLLIDFAEPLRALLAEDAGREAYEELLHVGALVWNAAGAYAGERLARELAGVALRLSTLSGAPPERVRAVLLQLAQRRHTRFQGEPRYIRGVEVLQEGGGEWRVLVASCLLPGDAEVRPSLLQDAGAQEHFIV